MKAKIVSAIKFAAITGAIASALYGCTKKDTTVEKISAGAGQIPTILSAGDGQNDLLGYGYDITGEYANSSASKFSVINVTALKNDQPLRVEWDLSKAQVGNLTSGENARSYLYKKTVKVNASADIPSFKASITTAFNSSDAFSSKYIYSSFDLIIKQKRVKLNADVSLLKSYLQPTFVADIQTKTPAQIVSTYGTHILTDIILGAKLEVMYQSESIASERSRSSEIGIDVTLKKIFNINTAVNYSYSEEEKNNNFSQRLYYRTIGGDPSRSIIGQITPTASSPAIDISNWQSSSTVANAELIDFGETGLLPIYELIDDPVKKTELQNYVTQYLQDRAAGIVQQKIYAKIEAENIDNHFYYDSYWSDVKTGDQYIVFYGEDRVTPAVYRGNIGYRYNIVHEDGTDIWRLGTIYNAWVENKHKYFLSRAFISSKGNKKHPWAEMMFEIMPGTGYEPINEQLDPRP